MRSLSVAFVLIAASLVAACGGGDGPVLSRSEVDQVRSDPRAVRAFGIVENANTLIVPAAYFDLTVSAQGQHERLRIPMNGRCSGPRCVLTGNGERVTLSLVDLLTPSNDRVFTRLELGHRAGMDTVIVEGPVRLSEGFYGGRLTANLTARAYGLWGQYGYASAEIASGPISGSVQGVGVTGDLHLAMSYVAGRPTGSNPTGFGSATWWGAAEAVSTRTYERRLGTATLTMTDLSVPRLAVDVDIAGYAIGSAAWDSIPIYSGRFATGVHGHDRLVGHFFGPAHQESYGAFDTGAYVGAFGAKRIH